MIALLLIGPSGVGKSTLGPPLATSLDYTYLDLDSQLHQLYPDRPLAENLAQWGANRFYQVSEQLIKRFKQESQPYLLDIGAGTQWAAQGQTTWLQQAHSLCLWAEPQVLWRRNQQLRQEPRSLNAFFLSEYNPLRNQLYQSCTYWLNSSHQTAQQVLETAQHLLREKNQPT